MKRSKAPSVLFANKIPRTDKEAKDAPPVNHLAVYAPKKEQKEKENEEPEEEEQQSTKKGKNIRMADTSAPIYFLAYYKSKNKFEDQKQGYGMMLLTFFSLFLFLSVVQGVLEVTYGAVYLYSKSCKQIGKATLSRSSGDDDGTSQTVKIKSKEVWFQEGFTVSIGNKNVAVCLQSLLPPFHLYRHNHHHSSLMNIQVRSSVTADEFKNGM